MQQFPGCPLPPVGVCVAASPLSLKGPVPAALLASRTAQLGRRVEFYRAQSRRLAQALATATAVADRSRDCNSIPCKTFVAQLIRPIVLRGQIDYTNLVGRSFAKRYADLRTVGGRKPEISSEAVDRDHANGEEFRRVTLQIVLQTLNASARVLDQHSERDKTGEVRQIAAELKRTARRLQLRSPLNDELFTLLELPTPPDDDQIAPSTMHR
jgi:hypothetical protein